MRLLAVPLFGLLTAACAASPPLPSEIVQRAGDTTMALKSATFDLVRLGEPVLLDPGLGLRFSAATGEYQAPDRVRARVKVAAAGTVLEIDMLWLPEGAYASNPFSGAFEKLPAVVFDAAALVRTEIAGVLRAELRDLALVGTEKLGATEAYHLRARVEGAKLRGITGGVTVEGSHTIDLWIDAATFRLLRLVDAEPAGPASGWRLELSGFDRPVEIKGP